MRARIVIIITIVVVAAAAYAVYQQTTATNPSTLAASGIIEATETNLGSQISGTIADIKIDEGRKVRSGGLLAVIDSPLLASQKEQAEAGITAANADIKQAADGSDAAQESAQAELKQAQAQLDAANIQIGFTQIVSPIAGVLVSLPLHKGDTVTPGTTVATVADLGDLNVDIFIPENDIGKVKIGGRANVTVDSYPNEIFTGRITKVNSQPEFTPANVETKEQRVKLVFAVTVNIKNRGSKLKPGMPADVSFEAIK